MMMTIIDCGCATCYKFIQFYMAGRTGEMEPVNRGYCGFKHRVIQPGKRCEQYRFREKSNIKTTQRGE